MADFTFAHREEGFDEHINRSVRGYSDLLQDISSLSRYFIEDETTVLDIGCSTGKVTEAMLRHNSDHCKNAKWVGVEFADGFKKDLVKREASLKKEGHDVEFQHLDIKKFRGWENISLITSIFTLQFMSKKDRMEILRNIYSGLNEGGAFIFAEKTICESALVQDMITFNYYDYKRAVGKFTTEDIMDKERTLRHMMKPLTWEQVEHMVRYAGFRTVQPFWRNHAFVGAIAIKEYGRI